MAIQSHNQLTFLNLVTMAKTKMTLSKDSVKLLLIINGLNQYTHRFQIITLSDKHSDKIFTTCLVMWHLVVYLCQIVFYHL